MDIKYLYKTIYNIFYLFRQTIQREIKFIINFAYKERSGFLYATATLSCSSAGAVGVAKSLHRPVARNGIKQCSRK